MGSPRVKVKAQVLLMYNDKILVYRVRDEKTGIEVFYLKENPKLNPDV